MVCKKGEIKLIRLRLNNFKEIYNLQEQSGESPWGKESLVHFLKKGSGSGFILYKEALGIGYILARKIQNDLEIISHERGKIFDSNKNKIAKIEKVNEE